MKRLEGGVYGSYWFTFINRKDIVMVNLTLKPQMGRLIESFLGTGIGGKTDHCIKGPGVTAH